MKIPLVSTTYLQPYTKGNPYISLTEIEYRMKVLLLLVLLLVSYSAGQTIIGTGTADSSDLINTLASDYQFAQDNIDIVYSPGYLSTYLSQEADFYSSGYYVSSNYTLLQIPVFTTAFVVAYTKSLSITTAQIREMFNGTFDWSVISTTCTGQVRFVLDNADSTRYLENYLGVGINSTQLYADGSITYSSSVANYIAKNNCTLTFCSLYYANKNGLIPATVNSVVASVTTITSAIDDSTGVQPACFFGNCGSVDSTLLNVTSVSWPMCGFVYMTTLINQTVGDCSLSSSYLDFVSWIIVNAQASNAANNMGYVIQPVFIRRLTIDLMGTIMCNNNTAFTTAVLIGSGVINPVFTGWANAYQTNYKLGSTITVNYIVDGSKAPKAEIANGTIDYSSSNADLSAAEKLQSPDIAVLPVGVYAISMVYNLGYNNLVLSLPVLVGIYMNEIKYWNDSSILALNPDMPVYNQPIIVIMKNGKAIATGCFTYTLSKYNSTFATNIGQGNQVTWPIDKSRLLLVNNTAAEDFIVQAVKVTPYSLAFWSQFDVNTIRNAQVAGLWNYHKVVYPTRESVISAINGIKPGSLLNGTFVSLDTGVESWPMSNFVYMLYHTKTMADKNKASALLSWLYWTQTSTAAATISNTAGVYQVNQASYVWGQVLSTLINTTSGGVHINVLYDCYYNFTICSNRGTCSGTCICPSNYTGEFCQLLVVPTHGSTNYDYIIAIVVPIVAVLLMICAFAIIVIVIVKRNNVREEWIINYNELNIEETIGEGGFGVVYKGKWKGTEVAIKTMTQEIGDEEKRKFIEEIEIMSKLRHPNVVLFMAASTKSPMCIVMEYMPLGSLYDVIHNELIPDIPTQLKIQITQQAAKGMHFLHSNGVTHRDLKSLNILLDARWNAKIADFGLASIKGKSNNEHGTIAWTAPEILADEENIDYMMSDVYAFGIIMWELTTRQKPYYGMVPAQIAVQVLRYDLRPDMKGFGSMYDEYSDLMTKCWEKTPAHRPVFLDVMNILQALSTGSSSFNKSSSSTYSSGSMTRLNISKKDITFAICDLIDMEYTWERNPIETKKMILDLDEIIRTAVFQRGMVFSDSARNSGGTFFLEFDNHDFAYDAVSTIMNSFTQLHGNCLRIAMHFEKNPDTNGQSYSYSNLDEPKALIESCEPGNIISTNEYREIIKDSYSDVMTLPTGDKGSITSSNKCEWLVDAEDMTIGLEIGKGNYGRVSAGKLRGEVVAIKTLLKRKLSTKEMLDLRTEAAILWKLNHPNIIKLKGLCISEPSSIVYEIVSMGNLRNLLTNNSSKKLEWKTKMSILLDVARGIKYLHENSIIHRDIKSSNILIDNGYKAKLGDFGFITIQQDCTMTRCGTPCWIAPEIMQGDKYDESADVYSLGIVMWEILTGKIPYDGEPNIPDIIKGERPPVPKDCEESYATLMKMCWHTEPKERPIIEDIIGYLESEDYV